MDLSHLETKVDLVTVSINERHISIFQKGQVSEESPNEGDQRRIKNVRFFPEKTVAGCEEMVESLDDPTVLDPEDLPGLLETEDWSACDC